MKPTRKQIDKIFDNVVECRHGHCDGKDFVEVTIDVSSGEWVTFSELSAFRDLTGATEVHVGRCYDSSPNQITINGTKRTVERRKK